MVVVMVRMLRVVFMAVAVVVKAVKVVIVYKGSTQLRQGRLSRRQSKSAPIW